MSNPYGQYLRSMTPFISSAPAAGETASMPVRPVDPRAIDRAVRSFHNRLGRPPTEQELNQAIPHYLPTAMPGAAGGFPAATSPFGVQPFAGPFASPGAMSVSEATAPGFAPLPYGQTDDGFEGEPGSAYESGETARDQIAFAENLWSSTVIDPGSIQELNINFGKGQYRAWVRVTSQGSWSSRISPPERRSPLMGGPQYQVDMGLTGEIVSADRMHGRPISLRVANNLPAGRAVVENLNDGATILGSGGVRLEARNGGPHPVEVVLGAYKQ